MKNGFFNLRFTLPLFLCLIALQGCASFLEIGDREDPREFDRGYSPETDQALRQTDETDTADRTLASTADDLSYEQRRIKRAIETRDVILGMTRQEVSESWGSPTQREVAGRGAGGHERWTYGSRFSLSGPRTVIFENGRVAGWSH